jgi:hypothetical protein
MWKEIIDKVESEVRRNSRRSSVRDLRSLSY